MKTNKKNDVIVMLALIVCLVLSVVEVAYGEVVGSSYEQVMGDGNEQIYSDMEASHWAWEDVKAMTELGVIEGCGDGTFKPENKVTYGEFIKMAYAVSQGTGYIEERNESTDTLLKTSVEAGQTEQAEHWAMKYYEAGLKDDLFTRYDIDKTQLDEVIPRGNMALIVSNILGDIDIQNYDEIQASIHDVNSKTNNEYAITKAYYTGIIKGYENGTFGPEQTLTRSESAAVIHRIAEENQRMATIATEPEEQDNQSTQGILDSENTNNVKDNHDQISEETIIGVTEGTKEGLVTKYYDYRNDPIILYEDERLTEIKLLMPEPYVMVEKEIKLGEYGIEKLEEVNYGYIEITSTVQYEFICLLADNEYVRGFDNPEGGSYWTENGKYLYYAEPEKYGIDIEGKALSVYTLDKQGREVVYRITDFKFSTGEN